MASGHAAGWGCGEPCFGVQAERPHLSAAPAAPAPAGGHADPEDKDRCRSGSLLSPRTAPLLAQGQGHLGGQQPLDTCRAGDPDAFDLGHQASGRWLDPSGEGPVLCVRGGGHTGPRTHVRAGRGESRHSPRGRPSLWPPSPWQLPLQLDATSPPQRRGQSCPLGWDSQACLPALWIWGPSPTHLRPGKPRPRTVNWSWAGRALAELP